MVTSIITASIPIILEAVMFFIRRSKLSDEAKKNFFEWVNRAGNDLGSVKLMEAGQKQLKWLSDNPWKPSP